MISMCFHTFFLAIVMLLSFGFYLASPQSTPVVNIGAMLAYDSIIGRVAKKAITVAVADINRNGSLLNGSKLVVQMLDTNCSAFLGAAGAMELLKKEVVAVVGPQSTAVSHFVGQMGGATQIPMVSFAATDPALSEFQYPFFFRIAHNDAVQMQAIASFIGFYGWREVVALFSDDDFGANGAAALGDALVPVGARLVQKAALAPEINRTAIGTILTELAGMQTRVFVVHMPQKLGITLFSEAKYLGMMSTGYVWIASDAMTGTLGSTDVDVNIFNSIQAVVGTRGYYAQNTPQLQSFLSEWDDVALVGEDSVRLNVYGLYAYDATWVVAHALGKYLKTGHNITFTSTVFPSNSSAGASELAQLKVFDGGSLLRTHILETKFVGLSGPIQVDAKGDLVRSAFEIVNVVGEDFQVVGYWSNQTQLTVSAPNPGISNTQVDPLGSIDSKKSSLHIVWPGNTSETPRGWVLPKNGRPLNIAVPSKVGFQQFVSWSSNSTNFTSFHGFCIDVFESALKYLPYSVPYNFVLYGRDSPFTYDDMIDQLANKVYDAVVGDVTITTKRMEKVDFTQPYTESGLVVVVPIRESHSFAWAFLRPFNASMWLTTLAFFCFTGVVIWVLEHKKNRDFRGRPKKQVVTVLWFTFSTLFFAQREKTKSTLGRVVILIWLFVVLIITSSYTANLTSILTVQQLTPTIQGINSLQATNVPIGYQAGSFAKDYLISLNIAPERLKPLPSVEAYANALTSGPNNGGVAAIVDELPYVQVFLASQCGFTMAGQEFTKGGWGFAFPRDSELAVDMSTAVLTLSETGQLQQVHDLWLSNNECGSVGTQAQSNQLNLDSFWGLFLVTGLASIASLLIYLTRLLCQFHRNGHHAIPDASLDASLSSRSKRFIKSFVSYVDESGVSDQKGEAAVGATKKKAKKEKHSHGVSDQGTNEMHRREFQETIGADLNGSPISPFKDGVIGTS